MKNEIRVFIASKNDQDRKLILSALTGQNGLRISGVENNEASLIIKSERVKPDVLILDFPHSGMSGHELAPIIHRKTPGTVIVMLCDKDEENYAGLALKSGIAAFLLKEKDIDKLVHVISIVYNGGYYISAPVFIKIFNAYTFMTNFPGQVIEQKNSRKILSPVECCIITDLAQGLSYKEAAEHLHYSVGTLKNYMSVIKRKTKLKNRIQIIIYALVYGLINFEQLGLEIRAPWENIREERLIDKPA